jgi:hypothetical protein
MDQHLAPVSDRSRAVALALASLFGAFGVHRFYTGRITTGVLMLCTLGGMGIWWLTDVILLAAGSFRDAEGRRVYRWSEAGSLDSSQLSQQQIEVLLSEVDTLRSEVAEFGERMDFMERMLAQVRQRSSLPEG